MASALSLARWAALWIALGRGIAPLDINGDCPIVGGRRLARPAGEQALARTAGTARSLERLGAVNYRPDDQSCDHKQRRWHCPERASIRRVWKPVRRGRESRTTARADDAFVGNAGVPYCPSGMAAGTRIREGSNKVLLAARCRYPFRSGKRLVFARACSATWNDAHWFTRQRAFRLPASGCPNWGFISPEVGTYHCKHEYFSAEGEGAARTTSLGLASSDRPVRVRGWDSRRGRHRARCWDSK